MLIHHRKLKKIEEFNPSIVKRKEEDREYHSVEHVPNSLNIWKDHETVIHKYFKEQGRNVEKIENIISNKLHAKFKKALHRFKTVNFKF